MTEISQRRAHSAIYVNILQMLQNPPRARPSRITDDRQKFNDVKFSKFCFYFHRHGMQSSRDACIGESREEIFETGHTTSRNHTLRLLRNREISEIEGCVVAVIQVSVFLQACRAGEGSHGQRVRRSRPSLNERSCLAADHESCALVGVWTTLPHDRKKLCSKKFIQVGP